MADYLAPLNAEQLEAVRHEGSPLLILAGAGSGKTRVITTKIAYLIRELGVEPESILAVTFTNKAAREMAERAAAIEPRASRSVLRTFHSFGAWFLRRNGQLLGLDSRFVIYDDDDMTTLLGAVLEDLPRAQAAKTAHLISRAKDYFLNPDDPTLDLIDHREEFRDAYRAYEQRLARIGNVDFGDLIKKPVELLRAFPEVRERFRQRFRVILVDEYQDSNVAQFELLKELVGPETYLCVVGDDDQSIYRFRGAEVRNILDFPDRFPGTQVIRLETNYRSTQAILEVASSVVAHNEGRLGKTLVASRGEGRKPCLVHLADQDAEASFCAELVSKSVKEAPAGTSKARWQDWAILYRTNAQSLTFETEFLRRRIPYRVVGSLKFYEREEVKDALALLAFSLNRRDEVAFRRMVNKPSRGVGDVTVEKIVAAAASGLPGAAGELGLDSSLPGDLAQAARALAPAFSAKARSGIAAFLACIDAASAELEREGAAVAAVAAGTAVAAVDAVAAEIAMVDAATDALGENTRTGTARGGKKGRGGELRAGEGLSPFIVRLVLDSGLADYHRAQDEIAGTQRLANLQELANAASLYPPSPQGLTEFLEHIELDRAQEQQDQTDDAVTLITVHNTKGLEFPRVVMTGLEQGVFPRDDKKDEDLEEERRLFYVGATRAKDELYLTTCALRRLYGRTQPSSPSLFLEELDSGAVRVLGETPRYGQPSWSSSVAPRSVRAYPVGPAPQAAASRVVSPADIPARDRVWQVGGRLYHDDYGYGVIQSVAHGADGPTVVARFESGQELRFMARHQGKSFMRVADDD